MSRTPHGGFGGEITDSTPVSWTEYGTALIAGPTGAAAPSVARRETL